MAQPTQQTTMGIALTDIETIKPYVLTWINEATAQQTQSQDRINRELLERGIRVEEELKNQRGIMQQGFSYMEKRFEQVDEQIKQQREEMNLRFEQVDKRFEQVDKRFEQVDKRFEQMDKRFEQVDKRFEQVEKRIEQVDKRFEQVDKRFDKLFQNFRWSVGAFIAFWGVTLASIQYFLV